MSQGTPRPRRSRARSSIVVRRMQPCETRLPRMLFLERGHPVKVIAGPHAGERGVVLGRTQELHPAYRVLLAGRRRALWFAREEIIYARALFLEPRW